MRFLHQRGLTCARSPCWAAGTINSGGSQESWTVSLGLHSLARASFRPVDRCWQQQPVPQMSPLAKALQLSVSHAGVRTQRFQMRGHGAPEAPWPDWAAAPELRTWLSRAKEPLGNRKSRDADNDSSCTAGLCWCFFLGWCWGKVGRALLQEMCWTQPCAGVRPAACVPSGCVVCSSSEVVRGEGLAAWLLLAVGGRYAMLGLVSWIIRLLVIIHRNYRLISDLHTSCGVYRFNSRVKSWIIPNELSLRMSCRLWLQLLRMEGNDGQSWPISHTHVHRCHCRFIVTSDLQCVQGIAVNWPGQRWLFTVVTWLTS